METTRLVFAIIFLSSLVFGVMLFITSQKVQGVNRDIRTVDNAVDNKKESIRVLNAEWHYLNRPDRLERLVSGVGGDFKTVHIMGVDDVARQEDIIQINGIVPVPVSKPRLVNGMIAGDGKGFGELLSGLSSGGGSNGD